VALALAVAVLLFLGFGTPIAAIAEAVIQVGIMTLDGRYNSSAVIGAAIGTALAMLGTGSVVTRCSALRPQAHGLVRALLLTFVRASPAVPSEPHPSASLVNLRFLTPRLAVHYAFLRIRSACMAGWQKALTTKTSPELPSARSTLRGKKRSRYLSAAPKAAFI
jgi:hypothetical protein